MMHFSYTKHLLPILTLAISAFAFKGETEPWTANRLMEPAELAEEIRNPKASPYLIISTGPGDDIQGSVHFGAGSEKATLEKIRKYLADKDRNARIVLYCGCCPFQNCPNIRPAFSLLNDMGFKAHMLLNLKNNLKTDWIDKGYPVK